MSCSLDKWNYFHDRKNKKGIVVNTFTCEDSDGDEPQLNVFVVDTPDNNDWHNDMEEIQECNCGIDKDIEKSFFKNLVYLRKMEKEKK